MLSDVEVRHEARAGIPEAQLYSAAALHGALRQHLAHDRVGDDGADEYCMPIGA